MAATTIEDLIATLPDTIDSLFGRRKSDQLSKRYIMDLCDAITAQLGVLSHPFYKTKLLKWVRDNAEQATAHADTIITAYILEKTGKILTIHQSVNTRVNAWKKIGVSISADMQEKIKKLAVSPAWTMGRQGHQAHADAEKKHQLMLWKTAFGNVIEHAQSMDGAAFRKTLQAIAMDPPPSIIEDTMQVIRSLKTTRKGLYNTDDQLLGHVLKGTAFALHARATGIRGGHILFTTFTDMVLKDGLEGIFQKFVNAKAGNSKSVARECVVRVVSHKDPSICAIVSLAQLVVFIHDVLDDKEAATRPFAFGCRFNPNNMISAAGIVRKSMVANIETLSVASGMANGMAGHGETKTSKKLHLFRSLCANELINAGATKDERQAHCGWATSVDDKYYSVQENIAAASRTPFLLAGRTGANDPAHAMWDLLDDVPTTLLPAGVDGVLAYFYRVHLLALAGGFSQTHFRSRFKEVAAKPSFKTFAAKLLAHITVSTKAAHQGPMGITGLKRQLMSAATENEVLRMKLAKYETAVEDIWEGSTTSDLKKAVSDLMAHNKADDFLGRAQSAVTNTIKPLVNKLSTNGNFGIRLETAVGRPLILVLLLVAAAKKGGDDRIIHEKAASSSKSWVGWVKNNRGKGVFSDIPSNKWAALVKFL